MARPLATQSNTQRAGELSFEDVPVRLRPSAFRQWLATVPASPVTAEELDAAYGGDWQPNPFADGAAPDLSAVPINAHWRGLVASRRHHDAYMDWLDANGLTTERRVSQRLSLGVARRGWRWSEFQRWEAQCAS